MHAVTTVHAPHVIQTDKTQISSGSDVAILQAAGLPAPVATPIMGGAEEKPLEKPVEAAPEAEALVASPSGATP